MSLSHSPKIVTDGLVFAYDMGNPNKSWIGQPTTNLVGDGMSIYNNVPSDVSVTLTATNEKYKGATVYKQVIKPITTTGVSYLTNGNNPGIGVVSSGGGGTASRYTGHAIYYKPTTAMHSTPLFTNYSNIGGWGAGSLGSNRSVAMGDGWFRGEVIWYDTVTRSDGKYWAINPANVALNVPITVYWAGPFKEDRNDSTMVAQYTTSTRSNTQAIIDLTGNNTITASSLTYASDGTFSFNGSSNYCHIPSPTTLTNVLSFNIWFKCTQNTGNRYLIAYGRDIGGATGGMALLAYGFSSTSNYLMFEFGSGVGRVSSNLVPTVNQWYNCTITADGTNCKIYLNGELINTASQGSGSITTTPALSIGSYLNGSGVPGTYFHYGSISTVNIYNRALSAAEVKQNFNALRGRFGI